MGLRESVRSRRTDRAVVGRLVSGLLAVAVFVLAIRLLATAVRVLTPRLAPVFDHLVVGGPSALGVGWLSAYLTLNGSLVAAVALSASDTALVDGGEVLLLVVGSRLGAAGIVIFVGAVDALRHRRLAHESVGLGVLTALVGISVFVPVAVVASALLDLALSTLPPRPPDWVDAVGTSLLGTVAETVVSVLGAPLAFLVALGALLGSLELLDRTVSSVDGDRVGERVSALHSPWRSFGAGVVFTALTTSVAVSVGLLVPLYNRDYVDRDALVPYLLGASVGTLSDTLVVALVLSSRLGLAVVLLVAVLGGLVAVGYLLAGERYVRLLGSVHDRLLADRRALLVTVAVLVAVPLGLLVVG